MDIGQMRREVTWHEDELRINKRKLEEEQAKLEKARRLILEKKADLETAEREHRRAEMSIRDLEQEIGENTRTLERNQRELAVADKREKEILRSKT